MIHSPDQRHVTLPRSPRLIALVLALWGGGVAAQTAGPPSSPDGDIRTLFERASRDTPKLILAPSAATTAANVLWTMQAADNAACVRGTGDIDGDGVDDAVSGHDISGTADNLFAISGASSGAAATLWSIETQGGASGGSFWGDDSVSVASDITGDGVREILGAVAWGGRTANCFDGSSGALVWQLDTYNEAQNGWVYSIHEMPDITTDGVPEVIFGCGSTNDSVYCIDGASRGTSPTVLWSYKAPDAVFAVTWVPDVSGDGLADVIAGTGDNDGRLYCLRSDLGTPLWTYDPGGTVYSVDTIQDVDGDGARDVVAAVWNNAGAATCVSSATGQPLWTHAGVGGYGMKVAPLADATGDGIDEVLVGSWNNAVLCLDGATGATLWSAPTGTKNGGDVWTVSSIPDVDGDGVADAIAGSFDTLVYGLSGADGSILWTQATANRIYSVSWTGDANGDGKPEALAGTQDTANQTLVWGIEGDSGLIPPYLVLTGSGGLGTPITMRTTALPGNVFALFLALGTGSINIGPFGTLLLDPQTMVTVKVGFAPAGGTDATTLVIPTTASLIGLPLYFQSLAGPDLFAGLASFTNRVLATIH